MKMTTKMLAVAMVAVMALAAFASLSVVDESSAAITASGGTFTVDIDAGELTEGSVSYDSAKNEFVIVGELKWVSENSWPFNVTVKNVQWTNLTSVIVNGVVTPVSNGSITYSVVLDWDASKNIQTLEIKDAGVATKEIKLNMSGVAPQYFEAENSSAEDKGKHTSLDDALVAAGVGGTVTVLKAYTPSYTGEYVDFGKGYYLNSKTHNINIVPESTLDPTKKTVYSLRDHQASNVYCMYHAYKSGETGSDILILQPWNLAPIEVVSVECSAPVEYNGNAQEPVLVVKDVNGNEISEYSTAITETAALVNGKMENAGNYTISVSVGGNYTTKDSQPLICIWTILPYDLSKLDRLKFVAEDNMVYDGNPKSVAIVLSTEAQELAKKDANGFNISIDNEAPVLVTEYNNITRSATDAELHTVYLDVNALTSGAKNFTSGIKDQPILEFTFTIAKKSLVGLVNVKWVGDVVVVENATEFEVIPSDGSLTNVCEIEYESNDGQRKATAAQWAIAQPYGTWYGVVKGVGNYTGSVTTATGKVIKDDSRVVYSLGAAVLTDQGKSLRGSISPAIEVLEGATDRLVEANLYIDYTTVKIVDVDGVQTYMYTPCQKVLPISIPQTGGKVSSYYVSFDEIFIYAELKMVYRSAPSTVTESSLATYDVTNLVVFNPTADEWAKSSIVTIVDANDNVIEGAVLKIGDKSYRNGSLINGGVQTVKDMKVAYVDKNGAPKDFDVSNYSILEGKVLFDGRKFVVEDIVSPTENISVLVDKQNAAVGELIKIGFKDIRDVNFSVDDIKNIVGTDATYDDVVLDVENWTLTAKKDCKVQLILIFSNGVKVSKTFTFGTPNMPGDAVSNEVTLNGAQVKVYSIYNEGENLSTTSNFIQGEVATLEIIPGDTKKVKEVRVSNSSNGVNVGGNLWSISVPSSANFRIVVETEDIVSL